MKDAGTNTASQWLSSASLSLSDTLDLERRRIRRLRSLDKGVAEWNPKGHLVGLALSGGGIRSATFCLGVLQAFAQRGWLRRFDLLSTVSGGGYIGAWLSALIYRIQNPFGKRDHTSKSLPVAIAEVERHISPRNVADKAEEPIEIAFLRAHSNYLTPKVGLFSGDTLAALVGYLRNLTYNLLLAFLSLGVLLALIHGPLAWLVLALDGTSVANASIGPLISVAAGFCGALLTIQALDERERIQARSDRAKFMKAMDWLQLNYLNVLYFVGAILLFVLGPHLRLRPEQPMSLLDMTSLGSSVGHGVAALFWAWLGSLFGRFVIDFSTRIPPTTNFGANRITQMPEFWQALYSTVFFTVVELTRDGWRYLIAMFACVLAVHAMLAVASLPAAVPPFAMMFRGPVITAAILTVVLVVWLGAIGTIYADQTREWLSRLTGILVGTVVVWATLGVIVLNAHPFSQWLVGKLASLTRAELVTVGVALLGIAAASTFAVKRTSQEKNAKVRATMRSLAGLLVVVMVASAATILFQTILLSGQTSATPFATTHSLAELVSGHHMALNEVSGRWDWPSAWWWNDSPFLEPLMTGVPSLTMLVLLLVAAALAFRYIDVNEFSLQNLYRNRLVRCYLGAAHGSRRMPDPFTAFDPSDDLHMSALSRQRPVHIVNTTINLSQDDDLARQQRQADSFTFSARHSGFWQEGKGQQVEDEESKDSQGGYVATRSLADEDANGNPSFTGVRLGTAMATSGAAVSSQMGFASSRLFAFLLTLLNVRLGRWFPNPAAVKDPQTMKRKSPRFAAFWFLRELLGSTNKRKEWVYLSDGGHFENLGIYELVRRRCRYIVAVDAGADPESTFSDLGNAVRKCRVDFGVDIQVDLTSLTPSSSSGRPRRGSVLGKVTYPTDGTQPGFTGDILYIKLSLPSDLNTQPADILAYRKEQPAFPHQPTTDQWFTEAQFESYRELGFLVGSDAIGLGDVMFKDISKA